MTPGVREHVLALKFRPQKADVRVRIRAFMFGRFRHLFPATQWVLGVATVWADAGYLPQAGPVPLRFRALAPPVSEQVNEPVAPAPRAPISLPSPPIPPIPPVTNGPALEFNAREPVIDPAPVVVPEAAVSPQMLMKFFTAPTKAVTNTNATDAGVMAPVGFTPPLVATPPASSQAKPASPP
jgi:hypothetical protein